MMPPAAASCPPPEDLHRYAAGRVSPRDCDVISQHVSHCPHCVARLEQWEREVDEVVEALRGSEVSIDAAPERELRSMVARLQASPPAMQPPAGRDAETIAPSGDATSQVSRPGGVSSPTSELDLPRRFGRYRLLRRLGDGGMGSVYLAHDSTLDRHVALKIPHLSTPGSSSERQRFLREARSAAMIVHPQLCPIYDVGEIDGVPFLTMQLIEGPSLAERIRLTGRFAPREAVGLVRRIALALAAAHARGVIHRDVKSANILLTDEQAPLLTDFGLARRLVPGEAELSRDGLILGTPGYMSPEQARGDADVIGPSADIYGLGVVLYELVTGRRPFTGTVPEVLAAVLHEPPRPPSTMAEGIDPALDAIVLKALSKTVAGRYGSMTEFAAALEDYASRPAAATGGARRPGGDEAGRRPPRAWRTWGLWCGGAGLLAGAVLILTLSRRGEIEIRFEEQSVAIRLLRDGEIVERIAPQSAPQTLRLSAGDYTIEVDGSGDAVRVTPPRFSLERGERVIVEVTSPPAPPANAVTPPAPETSQDFAIPLNGLTEAEWLRPTHPVPAWKSPRDFAELSTIDVLEYPTLPVTRFAFETEIEFRETGRSIEYRFVDVDFRLWIRLQWVPERNAYRAILQRYHKRGSWVIGQYFFPVGERLNLRLIVCDGMSQLYRGDELILANPTVAAQRALHIATVGEQAGGMTIHTCRFRPLTPEEVAAAEKAAPAEQQPGKEE